MTPTVLRFGSLQSDQKYFIHIAQFSKFANQVEKSVQYRTEHEIT